MQKKQKNTNEKTRQKSNSPIGMHAEIDKGVFGMLLTLQSVTSVTDVRDEGISMRAGKSKVEVSGTGLELSVYENKIVEISGNITKVEFL